LQSVVRTERVGDERRAFLNVFLRDVVQGLLIGVVILTGS
jgi:hypothetical protein